MFYIDLFHAPFANRAPTILTIIPRLKKDVISRERHPVTRYHRYVGGTDTAIRKYDALYARSTARKIRSSAFYLVTNANRERTRPWNAHFACNRRVGGLTRATSWHMFS